jgi:hypothetical protein
MKFTGKNKKIILETIGIFFILAFAVVAVDVFYIQPQSKTTGTSKTTGLSITSTNTAAMTIYYTDGSQSTIQSTTPKIHAASLVDASNSKTVSSINTNLDMIPTFTGSVQSYTINAGAFNVAIYTGSNPSGNKIYSASANINPISPLPTLTSGNSVIVCSSTVNSNSPPFTGINYINGVQYTLVDTISGFSISGTFTDGSTFGPVAAGTAQITWTFMYQSSDSFTGLSVNFALSAS